MVPPVEGGTGARQRPVPFTTPVGARINEQKGWPLSPGPIRLTSSARWDAYTLIHNLDPLKSSVRLDTLTKISEAISVSLRLLPRPLSASFL